MKNVSIKVLPLIMLLLLGTIHVETCRADILRHDRDISGKVIDADTGAPLEGVVVSAIWHRELSHAAIEPKQEYYNYIETLTNKAGEFTIPGQGWLFFSSVTPPKLALFKAGYSIRHLQSSLSKFKKDHPLQDMVKWVDGKPVIALPEPYAEERIRYLNSNPKSPFPGVPPGNVPLFSEEIERAYADLNMFSPNTTNPRLLRCRKLLPVPGEEEQQDKHKH